MLILKRLVASTIWQKAIALANTWCQTETYPRQARAIDGTIAATTRKTRIQSSVLLTCTQIVANFDCAPPDQHVWSTTPPQTPNPRLKSCSYLSIYLSSSRPRAEEKKLVIFASRKNLTRTVATVSRIHKLFFWRKFLNFTSHACEVCCVWVKEKG